MVMRYAVWAGRALAQRGERASRILGRMFHATGRTHVLPAEIISPLAGKIAERRLRHLRKRTEMLPAGKGAKNLILTVSAIRLVPWHFTRDAGTGRRWSPPRLPVRAMPGT